MKPRNLNANSWHIKLANINRNRVHPGSTIDICTYIRYVAAGLFQFTIIITFLLVSAVFVVALVAYPVMWWYQMIMVGGLVPPANDFAVIGTAVITLFSVWYTVRVARGKVRSLIPTSREKTIREVQPSDPGFISMVVEKVKSKTCFTVTFTEK